MVDSLDEVPEGMIGLEFPEASYQTFNAKGNLEEGVVYTKWTEIWGQPLDRAYQADFEVYDEKSRDRTKAEVDIFVSVNPTA